MIPFKRCALNEIKELRHIAQAMFIFERRCALAHGNFFVSRAMSFDGDLISSMQRETLTLPATPAA
jgi:hypothetical protein